MQSPSFNLYFKRKCIFVAGGTILANMHDYILKSNYKEAPCHKDDAGFTTKFDDSISGKCQGKKNIVTYLSMNKVFPDDKKVILRS